MDGKGRWVDNRCIGSLWRSLKYEDIYLNVNRTMREAQQGIGEYITFYNSIRPHMGLNCRTPDSVHCRKEEKNAA